MVRIWRLVVLLNFCMVVPAVSGVSSRRGDAELIPEEYSDTLKELLKNDKIRGLLQNTHVLKTIEKRLGSVESKNEKDGNTNRRTGGVSDRRDDIYTDTERDRDEQTTTCPEAHSKTGYIIKTRDSLGRGAHFIESPADLSSPDDCVQRCCQDVNCNTAVIKSSDAGVKMACYLFDCGNPNVCLFSPNIDFTVVQFSSRGSTMRQDQEEELAGLITTETTTTTRPASTVPSQSPDVVGRGCVLNSDCAGLAHSLCVSGLCTCRQGFHQFNNICKLDCREYEFECTDIDQDCIAIYDRCDGIDQCQDKSDELNCPDTDESRLNTSTTTSSPAANDNEKSHDDDKGKSSSTKEVSKGIDAKSNEVKKSKDIDKSREEVKDNDSVDTAELRNFSMPAHRGAVAALVLGIMITLMLLTLIGCRLRTMQRKSRKTRPVPGGGSDADYLINGMYL